MDNNVSYINSLSPSALFEDGHTIAWEYISKLGYPWEALPRIRNIILVLGRDLDESEYVRQGGDVWIHRTAIVAQSAFIGGAVIIGPKTEVRHCAFIRENALIGSNAVIGNSTELKNVILFDNVQVPHFNYVGDSILGYKAHMGAGSITSNVKSDSSLVSVICGNERIETGLKKFGAILGDNVEIGCNTVLNPGAVVGSSTNIYPLSSVRGYVPSGSIYKNQNEIVTKI